MVPKLEFHVHKVQADLGDGKVISIETGKLAKQADGATVVRLGDTMVLVTAVAKRGDAPEGQDFFPLQVEYREKYYAAGKFPGGFIKREGRPSEKEILSARLVDRAIRPLFPENFLNETQVVVSVISSDQQNDADVLGAIGASAALLISDIPFENAMSEVRVGRIGGKLVVNPTIDELKTSDLDITIGGTAESIVMMEGEMHEISEDEMIAAIEFGHAAIKKLCQIQEELKKACGKVKRTVKAPEVNQELLAEVKTLGYNRFKEIAHKTPITKEERADETKKVYDETAAALKEKYPDMEKKISAMLHDLEYKVMRDMILDEGNRLDGRTVEEVRPIMIELGIIPRAHGSALFTRGETQSLTTVTLGTAQDAQSIDTLTDTSEKTFMLNYNFPPFSVGEVGRMSGVGRREIGHGNLAERSLEMMMPSKDVFSYTIRIVSEILESNGSSSMATVCAGSLSLMDAGVPLKKPVAGIAMGLIKEGDKVAILSDILGNEDHLGDMDFKVAGTADGITACQMDIKISGLDMGLLRKALNQAKQGRLHILGKMATAITEPRTEMSQFAPRLTTIQIPVDSIGAVIGKGGETIKGIIAETGCTVDINDDGIVTVGSTSGEMADRAIRMIKSLVETPEPGTIYEGTVKGLRPDLGAFVEILPKIEGLLHISEISYTRVNNIEDVLQMGQKVQVKLLKAEKDPRSGKMKLSLSMKALLEKPEGYVERPPREDRGDRPRGGDRNGRDRDRGR